VGALDLARLLLEKIGWTQPGPWVVGIAGAAIVIAATIVVGFLLTAVVGRAFRRLAARTTTDLDDKIVDILEKPLRRLVVAAGLYEVTFELPTSPRVHLIASGVVLVYAVWIAIKLLTQVALLLLGAFGKRVEGHDFQKDYLPLLSKVLNVVVGVVGLAVVLNHFGQDVSSLIAALGIGGVAVSLAAKDTLGSMIAGFIILVDRPFRPGDRIRLATGEVGDVVDIGTRSTRVKLLDQNLLIVPNNELVNSRVVNFNFPSHSTSVTQEIRLPYGSDVDRARTICAEILRADKEIVQPAPAPSLASFGSENLVMSVSFTVSDFGLSTAVGDRIRSEIHRRFYEAGLRFAVPMREVVQAKA
jgi:small-conductance mechanosensitive channel